MSILIKGMEMPRSCLYCFVNEQIKCELYRYVNINKERHLDCPLVEVPTQHGDLVDRDKLMTDVIDSDLDHLQRDDWKEVIQIVEDAHTVIEAEGSEE